MKMSINQEVRNETYYQKKISPVAQGFCIVFFPSKEVLSGQEPDLMFMHQEWLSLVQDSRNSTENAALQKRLRQCCQRSTVLKLRWPPLRCSKQQEPDLHTLGLLIFPKGAATNCWKSELRASRSCNCSLIYLILIEDILPGFPSSDSSIVCPDFWEKEVQLAIQL